MKNQEERKILIVSDLILKICIIICGKAFVMISRVPFAPKGGANDKLTEVINQ